MRNTHLLVGVRLGIADGDAVGALLGEILGACEGLELGLVEGLELGLSVARNSSIQAGMKLDPFFFAILASIF